MCGTKNYDIKKEIEIMLVAKKKEDFQSQTERKRYSHKKITLARPL